MMREDYVLHRISELLNERGWTLYVLAKKADVSYSTLGNTFRRNNVPSVPTLMRICTGFDITMSEFFQDGAGEIRQLNIADQNLLAEYHNLPRRERKLVAAYLQKLLNADVVQEGGIQAENQPETKDRDVLEDQAETEIQPVKEDQPEAGMQPAKEDQPETKIKLEEKDLLETEI